MSNVLKEGDVICAEVRNVQSISSGGTGRGGGGSASSGVVLLHARFSWKREHFTHRWSHQKSFSPLAMSLTEHDGAVDESPSFKRSKEDASASAKSRMPFAAPRSAHDDSLPSNTMKNSWKDSNDDASAILS